MSNTKPTILFLGATGGCALACLTHTLKAGYPAIALVRTPSKLTTLLTTAGIPESTLTSLLTIHTGNALSVPTVKKALLINDGANIDLPATIISGLGAAPQLQFRLWPFQLFTIDNPTLCGTAAATLVTALRELRNEHPTLRGKKPLLSFVSTTGISSGPDEVPLLLRFLYHKLLAVPHVDKREMEEVFRGEGGRDVFRGVVGVRPTLLTDGKGVGAGNIKVGREASPAVGYTVTRADVGEWIFGNVVEGEGRGWEGEMVSLAN